jgi:branched-chain amino acid transport system substrate-binding protein
MARRLAVVLAAALLAACSGMTPGSDSFTASPTASNPPEGGGSIGTGQVKAALILPLSASGNAGAAGTSMRSAAELALAEFNVTDLQLLIKDDGGNAPRSSSGRSSPIRSRRSARSRARAMSR